MKSHSVEMPLQIAFVFQIGEEKATVIGLMRKAIAQQFTDEVR
jgi:hypothetical protein